MMVTGGERFDAAVGGEGVAGVVDHCGVWNGKTDSSNLTWREMHMLCVG